MNRIQSRGQINSRALYVVCIVIVGCLGGHYLLLRSYCSERMDAFILKCCRDCPDPCPDPCGTSGDDDADYEPPYFRSFRLRNNGLDPANKIKKVKIDVATQDPQESAVPGEVIWQEVPMSAFSPPLTLPLMPGGTWAPDNNTDPEFIYGVRVQIQMAQSTEWLTAEVSDIGGRKDVEVDVFAEPVLTVKADGTVEEVFAVRLWTWYNFAGGAPQVSYDDSLP